MWAEFIVFNETLRIVLNNCTLKTNNMNYLFLSDNKSAPVLLFENKRCG